MRTGAHGRVLVAARIAQGIGAAIIVPASLALVMHAFPARERPNAVALWAATAALAAGHRTVSGWSAGVRRGVACCVSS